ncbi:MAG: adenylosuccinate lyase [Spirochaetes bacterium]|nr:MAG: adenylosuccinate lyase [Spirochaetota bacterium]
METRNIFKNISPLDHRYYLSNRQIFERLSDYLSEEAGIRYCIKVEIALLDTLISFFEDKLGSYRSQLQKIEENITCIEIYKEEEKIHHNIRALVNVLKKSVPEPLRPYVHLGATSADIMDTAASMRLKGVVRNVIIPLLLDLLEAMVLITEKEANSFQAGRTHGQHAVPITFGFAMAEYVSRLGKSISLIEELSSELRGKLSGAVGAFNATSLIVSDPVKLEEKFLFSLGLKPSEHSTQIVEPEYFLRVLLEINVAFGIIANLADDLRHLQRSEIGEVRESFSEKQVGSSTMPQKRNPWNSEHVKSMWKAFSPRVISFFMDQISEHQRDLTNSASLRFIADYLAGFTEAVARMKQVVTHLVVDHDRLKENLKKSGDLLFAEPAYILLSASGDSNAHERIRRFTLECESKKKPLLELIQKDRELWNIITAQLKKTTGMSSSEFFETPENYAGKAKEIALIIAEKYKGEIKRIRKAIG